MKSKIESCLKILTKGQYRGRKVLRVENFAKIIAIKGKNRLVVTYLYD